MYQFHYTFNQFQPAELVAYLADHIAQLGLADTWQICWLQNIDQPVIGLLPITSWSVYPTALPDNSTERTTLKKQTAKDVTIDSTLIKDSTLAKNSHHVKTPRDDDQSHKSSYRPTHADINDENNHGNNLIDIYVVKNIRQPLNDAHQSQTYKSTYQAWIDELISYAQENAQHYNADSETHNKQKVKSSNYTDAKNYIDIKNNNEVLNTAMNVESNTTAYTNGFMGFIGYDIAAKQLSVAHGIKFANQPCAFMGHYDITLTPCYDKNEQSGAAITGWELNAQPSTESSVIQNVHKFLNQLNCNLDKDINNARYNDQCNTSYLPSLKFHSTWEYAQYQAAFEQIQHHLYQGDTYQINLTQCWQAKLELNNNFTLASYLPALAINTKAPYSGYIQLMGFELLSCSPELFLAFKVNAKAEQKIISKPIKGTIKRGRTPSQDAHLKQALKTSDKDRSENVMIVDLLRNDLGKYAKTGSVEVPKLFAIESFSNVHHMVSTVEATIKEDTHPLAVLFGSLPAGSITGTPKKRAVELISDLETSARGAYCGTMGYQNFSGSGQWNVLIRSLQASTGTGQDKTDESKNATGKTTQKEVSLWAGGAITVASKCQSEYQECIDKIGNLLNILDKKYDENYDKNER